MALHVLQPSLTDMPTKLRINPNFNAATDSLGRLNKRLVGWKCEALVSRRAGQSGLGHLHFSTGLYGGQAVRISAVGQLT